MILTLNINHEGCLLAGAQRVSGSTGILPGLLPRHLPQLEHAPLTQPLPRGSPHPHRLEEQSKQ